MATVETVRGPVDTADLGQTLMHEHVVTINAEVAKEYPDLSWTGDKEGVLREEMDLRIKTLAQLCAEGYSDRIVLSHDYTCYGDWVPKDWDRPLPDWTQTHISDGVVPALLATGVSGEQIEQMLVANPRRIFETQGGY
jgi:predicted metal-dependent phosphotriesterase family hydrolase